MKLITTLQKKLGVLSLCTLCISVSVFGQVKIGNNPSTIDASALLEMESTDQGMLTPRLTAAQRDAISSPATGLIIYNTTTDFFNYYDGTVWQVIDARQRDNYVLVKSVNDLPAAVGGVITLQSDYLYEINGTITLSDQIDMNNAKITGGDLLEDRLVYTGGSSLFTGNKGGTLRTLTFVCNTPGSSIFELNDPTLSQTVLVFDSYFYNCQAVGSFSGYRAVAITTNAFIACQDGLDLLGGSNFLVKNSNFFPSCSGTYIDVADGVTYDFIEIDGGFYHADGSAVAIDLGTSVILNEGGVITTSLNGTGTMLTGSPLYIG